MNLTLRMAFKIPFWKDAPFLRLLLPFLAGILLAYYHNLSQALLFPLTSLCIAVTILFSFAGLGIKFRFAWIYGVSVHILIATIGAIIMNLNRIPPIQQVPPFIVTIKMPLAEKPKTWKATCSGHINIYIRKDSSLVKPVYGDRILFLMPPDSSGRVFLRRNEFLVLGEKDINPLLQFLFRMQQWIVNILQRYIPGKKECGLAEALLIGYKNDLDRDLMKAYSNTGVVHVIAISGLHLGLIYGMLKLLFKRMNKWAGAILTILCLWIFSLLTGGSPSVMRSAVMFTFIIAGEAFSKNTSVFNNLAASAFFLLCYEPNWLWDIGFQLSYSALLSIVIFQKPVYHALNFNNTIVDTIWKLNAVTIAAQILTTPLCIYYFKQFPNLFLITNFIAVPLSSIILIGEIILCMVGYFDAVSVLLGKALGWLIKCMNSSIEFLGGFSFSVTHNLEINLVQAVILYCIIILVSNFYFRRAS